MREDTTMKAAMPMTRRRRRTMHLGGVSVRGPKRHRDRKPKSQSPKKVAQIVATVPYYD